ncbi:hypothetical protein GCM10010104_23530 [Streptomyces indiaensis]|uniref:Uncharacterized protein n=2 Tax=Streptomyces indiaensis TaxID=284033 RepID=A0ABP5Q9X3_9ACTN
MGQGFQAVVVVSQYCSLLRTVAGAVVSVACSSGDVERGSGRWCPQDGRTLVEGGESGSSRTQQWPGLGARCAWRLLSASLIVAGLVVALAPRFGGWLVAGWLAGIIVNLLTIPGHYDVALRDFGLLLGAVALARLAQRYNGKRQSH